MTSDKFWLKRFFNGNVRFYVQDEDTPLINRLRKFKPRNVSVSDDGVVFDVNLVHKREVIRLLGKRSYTVAENRNVFTLLNFLYTRTALVITAIVCIAAFVTLDQFVFRVKVWGISGDEHAQISAHLREVGITRMTPKNARNFNAVTRQIVERFDFVAAASATVQGSTLIFSIHRADNILDQIPDKDIVATHDGVITEIIVFSGTPVVTRGDVVRVGDVLVTGTRPTAIIHISDGAEVVCVINSTVIKLNNADS